MSDRIVATLVSRILQLLAEGPTDDRKALAREIWAMAREQGCRAWQFGYDAEEAAVKLGIARMAVDPDLPDEPEKVYWLFEDYSS